MKPKKILSFLFIALFLSNTLSVTHAYQNKSFSGRVSYQWTQVGSGMRKDTRNSGSVNWKKTDRPNHRLWVRIMTPYGYEMGRRLISQANNGVYVVPNTLGIGPGRNFKLEAGREHILNPLTRVSGIWSADS